MFLCPSQLASQESEAYHALLQSDADELDKERLVEEASSRLASTTHRWKILAFCEAILIFLLVGRVYYDASATRAGSTPSHLLYSAPAAPAREAVEYKVQVFHTGFHEDFSKYQEISNETDQAWLDLYNVGTLIDRFTRITKEEAVRLPNKTAPIPGDEDHYLVLLHVFHDLHCLNYIRRGLHPEHSRFNLSDSNVAFHLDHCVESLRRTLMCSPDLSLLVWQWEDERQLTLPQDTSAHECVNFDRLTEWAENRALINEWDRTKHLVDDLQIPIYHSDGSTSGSRG
ncbi:hypothetical protein MVEN_01406200 [Mycena venus]|uniref:Tat pathway signal sequence n=1 Tax=Mycena venus TaxID=2733690 RepID=A0A8H6XYS3_9AGAR|nr:hypothetical protein MVEN_01406200 [Mycena venus]